MTDNENQSAAVERIIKHNTTDNEKLIEEARDPNLPYKRRYDIRQELADALEAAEKAHTPNISFGYAYREGYESGFRDGERGQWRGDEAASDVPEPSADLDITLNTMLIEDNKPLYPEPQGEPSEHRDRIALAEFIDKALDGDAGYGVGEFLAGGILSFLSERTALHAAFEPQGEPSDAQIRAAAREYHERGNGEGSFDRMADHVRTSLLFRMGCALRAANEVR